MDERTAWIGLAALVDDIGVRSLHRLLAHTGDAGAAWRADAAMLTAAGVPTRAREKFHATRHAVDAEALAHAVDRAGITVIPLSDPRYPQLLATIHDPPITLFVRGDASLLRERSVAVVGTRTSTSYGIAATEALVPALARAGVVIVSGLAYGIDAAAHDACVRADGRTVAVLGTGIDDASVTPAAHRPLAQRILATGGCMVSEYVPGTAGFPLHFPARNRIVAGMTLATIVIEAPEDSGALITAQFSVDFGREVFAVPGPITSPMSVGVHALLKSGAAPATTAADVLDALHLDELLPPSRPRAPIPAGVPGQVFAALNAAPTHVDDLRERLGIPAQDLAGVLTTLELDGAVRDVGGGRYIRT